ncbi:hypothetical protein [Solilutibacter pythonis]|uniref:hypothetical protein n=1 Tax=Solilutibacter pythonis TaxID=2483112 RepID=UPI0011C3FFFA|nr:hypothetical protein [Lysobacter pythonis]
MSGRVAVGAFGAIPDGRAAAAQGNLPAKPRGESRGQRGRLPPAAFRRALMPGAGAFRAGLASVGDGGPSRGVSRP